MAEQHAAFVGTVPPNYDRYLGPLLFHPYADDLAARLPVARGTRVLEVACGTGIVTGRLVRRLAGQGTLVATDLNDAMIAHARTRVPADPALEWRQADGTSLPFPDRAFDAVVCEFGLMFFPDKAAGVREAFRVLEPGGTYLFNVWDKIEHNAVARISHDTIRAFFPDDPPQFYQVPFNLQTRRAVRGLLGRRGLRGRGVAVRREGRAEPVGRGCGHRARRGEPGARDHHGAPTGGAARHQGRRRAEHRRGAGRPPGAVPPPGARVHGAPPGLERRRLTS